MSNTPDPEDYYFVPTDDITAKELAIALPLLMSTGNWGFDPVPPDGRMLISAGSPDLKARVTQSVEGLPDNVRRYFHKVGEEASGD